MNFEGGLVHGGGRSMGRCISAALYPDVSATAAAAAIAASAHPLMAESRKKHLRLVQLLNKLRVGLYLLIKSMYRVIYRCSYIIGAQYCNNHLDDGFTYTYVNFGKYNSNCCILHA